MAKFKAAGTRRPKSSARSALPCLFLILIGFAGVFLLLYFVMQSSK